jgi:hypothetical protein
MQLERERENEVTEVTKRQENVKSVAEKGRETHSSLVFCKKNMYHCKKATTRFNSKVVLCSCNGER